MMDISQEIRFILVKDKCAEIIIGEKYFNKHWFIYFGEIQEQLLNLINAKIIVNMEKCVFISPTPFIALLLTLKECKVSNLCDIEFRLPLYYSTTNEKFWTFCRENGFYQIIKDLNSIRIKDFSVGKNEWEEHTNFEKLINAQIVDLKAEDNKIENIVNRLLSELNEEKIQLSNKNRNYFMVVLRNILMELFDNVDKHAYEKEAKHKICAIYIRIRHTNSDTIYMGKINNRYPNSHPYETVKPAEIYLQNAVEIYFQDLGQGMISSLKRKGVLEESKRPLREAIQKTFYSRSNSPRTNNTAVRGLQFLGQLMADRNDFISIYNEYEGVGTYTAEKFERNKKKLNTNKVCIRDMKRDEKPIKGLIYNFTLFNRETSKKIEYYSNKKDIWDIYSKKYEDLQFEVSNYRDKYDLNKRGKKIDWDWLWIIPKEKNTKPLILDYLSEELNNAKKKKLIVADIEDNEFDLFCYMLKDTVTKVIDPSDTLEEIYLVSKKLRFLKFARNRRNIFKIINEDFLTFNNNFNYLYKLKIYESKILAAAIETSLLKNYVITKGIIEWNPELELQGYINFDFLVSNRETNSILERNLKRILPYISDCNIYPIDLLTTGLVNSINVELDKKKDESCEFIGIGSVIVSGLTLQSNNFENNLNIHFFSRSKEKRQAALFFDPIYLYQSEGTQQRYIRNGKSYRIMPKGLEPKKVNTNSYINEADMYKMLHQFAYSSVLFGHLNIEGRHDLFSVNLNAFIYDRDTKLAQFVNDMIFYGLRHYFCNGNECVDASEFFEDLEYSSMIVYPYNSLTSAVLKQCEQVENFKEYIWGLTPVNIIYSGETLEYSDTYKDCLSDVLNNFKERYKDSKPLKVIVFDTLTYTGRTKENIQNFLRSLADVEVKFVNIIDAQISHYDKLKTELNYINLNIPLLGNKPTCEICTVLEKLVIFKETLIDAKLVNKIDEIIETWQVCDIRSFQNNLMLPDFPVVKATDFMNENSRYYVDHNIEFRNIVPLYLYMTNRIKLENDFSIIEDVLNIKDNVIDEQSIAFLAATFIMEYGERVYLSILTNVCERLFEIIFQPSYKMENKIYHLCLLSILSVDEKIIWRIIKNYLYKLDDKKGLLSASQEGQILMIYYISKIQLDEILGKEEFFYILKNKCKSGNGRLDLYKQFNCQLININGNVHNSPLKCMVDNKITDKHLILSSLELIKQSIMSYDLKFDILYEDRSNEEYTDLITTGIDLVNRLEEEIRNQDYIYEAEKGLINQLYETCLEIHSKLFVPYFINIKPQDRDKDNIVAKLNDLIDEHNEHNNDGKVLFNNDYQELLMPHKDISAIYYIWNNMLAREIYYILDNVAKYTEKDKKVFIEGEYVSGQVCIEIEEMNFNIRIYNNTNKSIENIRKALKQRYQKEVLDMLGVTIEYEKNEKNNPTYNDIFEENAIIAVIRIPNIYKIRRKNQ